MNETGRSDVLDVIRKKVLTCSLCNNRFGLNVQAHLPICLDCSHTFCFACLTGVRLGMGIFSTISCPTCGLETTAGVSGVNGLNRNETTISLINIMETHDVISRCSNPIPHTPSSSPVPPPSNTPSSSTPTRPPITPGSSVCHSPARQDHQSDMVENVVITIPQYRRLITDDSYRRISNRSGCQISLSIPHISLFAEPPPAVAIITFRGNQVQINDGKSLFRKFLRDIRPHSFSNNHSASSGNLIPFTDHAQQQPQGQSSPSTSPAPTFVRQTQSFTGHAVSSTSPVPPELNDTRTENFRVHLLCNYEAVGHMMGSRGSRLKELSDLTGCQLFVNSVENSSADESEGPQHWQKQFRVEIMGTHDKISVALPFVKMVLGRGEPAMFKVREFYGPTGQTQSLQPSRQQLQHLQQLHHLSQQGDSQRNGDNFPPPPGLDRDYSLPAPVNKSTGLTVSDHGISVFNPGEDEYHNGRGRGAINEHRRDAVRVTSKSTTIIPPLSQDLSAKELQNESEELSEYSSVHPDELISSHSTDDDDDDDDNSNKSPMPYTISPTSSPPPSSAFPNYFIQARVNKHSEVITLLKYNMEALFRQDGAPTSLANDIMNKSHCELLWLQRPGSGPSESVRITGEALNREKAKFLLNSFKREVSRVVVDENVFGATGSEIISRYVDCPVHFIPVLIGAGGYTIEDLQLRTSTRILINDHRDEVRLFNTDLKNIHSFRVYRFYTGPPPQICIIGTSSSVEDALVCIERLLVNHRFKYRQRPFSPSQRTRSLPTNPSQTFSPSPPSKVGVPIRKVNSDSDREMIEARLTDHQILRSHGQSPIATSVQQLQSNQPQSQQLNRLHIQRPVQQHFNQQQQHQQLQPPNRHQHYQQSQHSNTPLRSHNNHQRVLNESVSNNGDIIDTICTQLLCPDDKVSQLIGKKGSILRELKKISNCEISIERVAEADPSTSSSLSAIDSSKPPAVSAPQVVHISGSRADVLACVQLVNEVIELGPVIALKMQTKNMIIPHDKVPLVIGQRGITAKEMMRRSGCKIHVNETVDADDNCFIELTGTSEQLSVAEELISHVLEHGTKALGKRFQK